MTCLRTSNKHKEMAKPFETYYLDKKVADRIEDWVFNRNTPISWNFSNNVAFEWKHLERQKERWGDELDFSYNNHPCPGFSSRFIEFGSEHPVHWIPNCIRHLEIPELKKIIDPKYHNLNIWRMQAWMYPSVSEEFFNKAHNPHIDLVTRRAHKNGRRLPGKKGDPLRSGEGNIVLLYYINDADGDNYFYKIKDECIDHPSLQDDDLFHPDFLEIVHTETPEKGKLLVMDGDVIHASSSPSKGIRSTLNINLLP